MNFIEYLLIQGQILNKLIWKAPLYLCIQFLAKNNPQLILYHKIISSALWVNYQKHNTDIYCS